MTHPNAPLVRPELRVARRWMTAALLLTLAACGTPPTPSSGPPPASTPPTPTPTSAPPQVHLANLATVPYADRLVFNRIQNPNPSIPNVVHDTNVLRLSNTGGQPLVISALKVQDAWRLDNPPNLPLTLAPGASQELTLRFTATNTGYHSGSLTIASNDPSTPNRMVELRGLWQDHSEDNQEPALQDIVKALGYRINLVGSPVTETGNTALSNYLAVRQNGVVKPQGEEVISAYWQRADETQPVQVTQVASYHTQGDASTLRWYAQVNTGNEPLHTILTTAGNDAQSLLPHQNGSAQLASGSFVPASATSSAVATFGFKVDAEWSDPVKNGQTADVNHGCPRPCGQHLRFWPVRDRAGQRVSGQYLLVVDYAGINYDYQDQMYVISNLRPAPLLIDVGTSSGYTDPAGNVWRPDRDQNGVATYTPSTAIAEPSTAYTGAIAGTLNPQLYRTYRGNVGTSTPQDQRLLNFDIPVGNGTYQVKLHFADLAWTQAGKRVFDVSIENQLRVPNLDIAGQVGGKAALVVPVDVQVADGLLSLSLKASVDFPSIAGIEITPH
ncbi:malectin domain-containing carbohydrate-binding protein [Deinococcus humi]|uniref:Malectin domain-containing protein n=1 Tax=Deinococcus humi TaxID=662880 RepID=A0A7W8JW93_9DEIO|nr:malectin domain-containing carbohydrate-binding protein [Deinococcus humi]MBB5364386.1 hypothetical protein [Deinococcus humi]